MNNTNTREDKNNRIENVLVLQGGGSLGAFGCGVSKVIAYNNIKLDIIAGTSIGGVNAAILAGSRDETHPEQALEQFWLELSESFVDLDKVNLSSNFSSLPDFVEKLLIPSAYSYFYDLPTGSSSQEKEDHSSFPAIYANERAIRMKQLRSYYSSAIFGNTAPALEPPRYKMAIVTGAVIFVILNTLLPLIQSVTAGVPDLLEALILVVIMILLMTYVIMPTITWLLRPWLSKKKLF